MDQNEDRDSDKELYDVTDDESSDDDRSWVKEVKKQHKIIRKNKAQEEEDSQAGEEKVYEFNKAPSNTNVIRNLTRVNKASLGERLTKEGLSTMLTTAGGNREMKFSMRGKKSDFDRIKKMKKHHEERKQFVRRTGFLTKTKLPR